ncbi:hypothetical protein PILCRDRAFT_816410 [Piloderma croceum F 1598]|uniref:Uncharacterized protein n=1 Tax=Piloderma croceum (strain F 1598) TaxID=765440 RepID=A0A0C3FQP4_PILCF|nr:hypothetical protein PILCRDRAFT_816410 [Piloderma croceum F 1598]
MERFTGMTFPVAEYLATKVLCVLDNPVGDSQQVEASEFGTWSQDLPYLLIGTYAAGQRVISGLKVCPVHLGGGSGCKEKKRF